MITITVWNMKGGTGKSTITFNLANSLRMKGARVLVLDLDVQANLTSFFEKDIDRVKTNRADIAKMVEENIPLKKCIYRSRFKGLDFVKGSNGTILFEDFLSLFERLATVEDIYDFCLLNNVESFIMVHNHLGSMIPSRHDAQITDRMVQICDLMGLQMLDHIIVCGDNSQYYSFKEHDLIPMPRNQFANNPNEVVIPDSDTSLNVRLLHRKVCYLLS